MTNIFFFAPPREGKTYVVVAEAIEYLKKGKQVYSNFPIITPSGLISKVWKPEYIYENIQNALIIIDEAQRDFDSQTHKSLDENEDAFFATSGHNGLEIRIISQNLPRVTKAIRDRMNLYTFVKKGLSFPFLRDREGKWGRPLYFVKLSYLTLEDLESHNKERIYLTERILFKSFIAESYDTHYFKRTGTPFIPITWYEELKNLKADLSKVESWINPPKKESFNLKKWFKRTEKPILNITQDIPKQFDENWFYE